MTDTPTAMALCAAVSYLVGSIPTGLLLGRLYGIDVRNEGSGNIGATNLYRTVGRKVGILTLVGDALKGYLPVIAVGLAGFSPELQALTGLSAFLGHVFSIFLGFKGGKGVATALGVFISLAPKALLISLAAFILLVAVWRFVSLGSIAAAALMPLTLMLLSAPTLLIAVSAAISAVVILKHHENIRRLLNGTENRFKA